MKESNSLQLPANFARFLQQLQLVLALLRDFSHPSAIFGKKLEIV